MSLYLKVMQAGFKSSQKKTKLLKKIKTRMKVGHKALNCFSDLAARMENEKIPLLKLNPVYVFLNNGCSVLGSGKGLSDCFEGWFSPEQLVLLRTGEESGKIPEAIEQCMELESKIQLIKKTIKKAAIKPLFASVMLLGVLVGIYQKGIPLFKEIQPMEEWADMPLKLYELTKIFGSNPTETVAIAVSIFVAFIWAIPNLDFNSSPKIRDTLDKFMPFFGMYKTIQVSIFLRSFSTLLASGVRVKTALDMIVSTSPKYVSNRVVTMRDKIEAGYDLSECFTLPFLGESGQDLSDMAQGGDLEESLEEIATETLNEVIEVLPSKLSIVGTIMIAACVCVVVFALGAFYGIVGTIGAS